MDILNDSNKPIMKMSDIERESKWPNLKQSTFIKTSECDSSYNCIAYGAKYENWWEPDENYESLWPSNLPRVYTLRNFIDFFKLLNYNECDDGEFENGFEKIAIYIVDEIFPHVARQLENGKWTSKMGDLEDIQHDSCSNLEGLEYGKVMQYLKRKITS